MATIICGWCKEKCHMTAAGSPMVQLLDLEHSYHREDWYIVDAAFSCDGCGRMSVATWVTNHRPEARSGAAAPGPKEESRWSPLPGHNKQFPDVPPGIAEAAQEAWLCHVAGAHRGAVAVARAVVESTAKAKGHDKGQISDKIDALATAGQIRPAVREQAHEIRYLGNSVAHGDLDSSVTSEDAAEVLELMGEVLNEVFQSPERAARLRAAREAKKAATKVTDG